MNPSFDDRVKLCYYDEDRKVFVYNFSDGTQIEHSYYKPNLKRPRQEVLKVEALPEPVIQDVKLNELCRDRFFKQMAHDDVDYMVYFTDIFFNGTCSKIPFFKQATYTCRNEWDKFYLGEVLGFKITTDVKQGTIIMNPVYPIDNHHNFYTIPPNFNVRKFMCSNLKEIEIAQSPKLYYLSENPKNIYSNVVFTINPKLDPIASFKIVFYKITSSPISIDRDLYQYILLYLNRLRTITNVNIIDKSNINCVNTDQFVITSSGYKLYNGKSEI
jgi:hypothetical protein